jgi:YjbE family integral membrane protein
VAFRGVATMAVVWLMNMQWIMLIGGVALIFIAIKLMVKTDDGKQVSAGNSLIRAILTVVAADAIMGIDNVIAVAGVAQGHPAMVIIGLCISIPIMVFGSTLIMKIMNRFAFIVYIGAGVILYAAGKMITEEPVTKPYFEAHTPIAWCLIVGVTGGGLLIGWLYNRKKNSGR